MKEPLRCVFTGLALLLGGCSTPASRIQSHQANFNAWPAAVQAKVQAGVADVGFLPEMVEVALGTPDRISTLKTDTGLSEIWAYLDHGPRFSAGIGVAGGGASSAYGGGVAVSDQSFRDSNVVRVIFEGGKVTAIETYRK